MYSYSKSNTCFLTLSSKSFNKLSPASLRFSSLQSITSSSFVFSGISKINFTENIKADIEILFDEDFNYDIEDIKLYQNEFEFQLNEKFIESTEYEENY